MLLSESGDAVGSASLAVERGTSSIGVVTVFWEVAVEGRQDLEPIRGNLTFEEVRRQDRFLEVSVEFLDLLQGITQQSFTITAVQDGMPESFEAFPVELVAVMGGGRLVDPRQSIIAIQASDDPTGILALRQVPSGLVVNEGEELVVGVVRSAGTSGTVTLTWEITPPDGTVFATLNDTIVLEDGVSESLIRVQV